MRSFLALLALTTPAFSWEFSPSPVCTVSHTDANGTIELTYDPILTDPYAIAVTGTATWTTNTIFGLRFEGDNTLTITTDRHRVDGETLIVRDRSFGNVLNGLEFSESVTAFVGVTDVAFPLDGAAPEIVRFRACLATPIA